MIKTTKNRLIMLATFGTIYIFFLFFYEAGISELFGQREDRFLQQTPGLPAQQESVRNTEITIKTVTDYGAENLRDPFDDYLIKVPENNGQTGDFETPVEIPKPPTLVIQGIFWGASFPQAIVNKMVVKEGDTIQGVKIIRIKKEGLTLSFANTEYALSAPAYTGMDDLKHKKEGGME